MDIAFREPTRNSPMSCLVSRTIIPDDPHQSQALKIIGAQSREEALDIMLNRVRQVLPQVTNINDVLSWIQRYIEMVQWRVGRPGCNNQSIIDMLIVYNRDRRMRPMHMVFQHRWDDNTDEAAAVIAICMWDCLKPQGEPVIRRPDFVLAPMPPQGAMNIG